MTSKTNRPVASAVVSTNRKGHQIVLRHVMIDDHLGHGQLLEKLSEVLQLVPGAGVEDDGDLGIAPGVARRLEALDVVVGVEEVVTGRPGRWR